MKRKTIIFLVIVISILSTGCKEETICDLCISEAECRYYDDGYYCDNCYETLKELKKMDDEYNSLYN
jgi:hypothetical protein